MFMEDRNIRHRVDLDFVGTLMEQQPTLEQCGLTRAWCAGSSQASPRQVDSYPVGLRQTGFVPSHQLWSPRAVCPQTKQTPC